MTPEELDFSHLEKTLFSLKDALKAPPRSELERDGVIQRFVYTFDLSWKSVRKLVTALGKADVSGSPKPLLRDAVKERLFTDLKSWFGFLEARNLTAHIYGREEAEKVFAAAKWFPPFVEELLGNLKKRRADA